MDILHGISRAIFMITFTPPFLFYSKLLIIYYLYRVIHSRSQGTIPAVIEPVHHRNKSNPQIIHAFTLCSLQKMNHLLTKQNPEPGSAMVQMVIISRTSPELWLKELHVTVLLQDAIDAYRATESITLPYSAVLSCQTQSPSKLNLN